MKADNYNEIELKRFNNEYEAVLLAEHLKAQNIYAFVRKDDPAAMGIQRGASVIISSSDKDKALEILNDLNF